MKRVISAIGVVCVATLLCTLSAFAQTAVTGAIVGRAQDSTGAVIPGVEVTITSPDMIGGAKTEVTDEQGVYRFELLHPGSYKVSFALPGFKTINLTDVIVTPNNTMSINGPMEVSATAEEVTVTSQAPAIDLQAATVGVNWSQKMIDDLPWSRSLTGISSMLPGTYATSLDVGNANFGTSSVVAANLGGRSGGTAYIIDGLMWCQTYSNFGAFEEINVTTNAKGADQMNSGVSMSVISKSGSNMFHGTAQMDYQNGSMQSVNINQTLINQGLSAGSNKFTHFTDYFGDIGGPIMKDKLWFYFDARQGYQGTFIPGFITAVGGAPAVFNTVLRGPDAKLSYQITSKQKFDIYWGLPDKHQAYRNGSALVPQDATENQDSWSAQGPVFTWTDIIDAKTTATARLARGGYWWPAYAYSMPSGLGPTIASNLGCATDTTGTGPANCPIGTTFQALPTFTSFGVPNVGAHISDTTSGATDGSYDTNYTRPIRWQWNVDFSHVMNIAGKANEIKVGYMQWWDKSYSIDFRYPNQQAYVFKSTAAEACPGAQICNNYFLHPYEFTLDDAPYNNSQGGKYGAAYINDKITVNRKLTVNVGLRFDTATSFLDPQGNDGHGPYAIAYQIPYNGYNNTGTVYSFPSYPLFSPRASFAYDITGNGKLALKASYGRYYGITSSPNSQPGPGANSNGVDPISERTCTYNNWDGSIPVVNSLIQSDFGPDGLMGTADDLHLTAACPGSGSNGTHTFASNLKPAYLDEYAGGLEVGLNRNYSIRFEFQRKFDHNNATTAAAYNPGTTGGVANNVLLPFSAYTAGVCATDPGPLGANGGGVGGVGTICDYVVPNTGNSLGQPANPNFATTDVNYVPYGPHEGQAMYTSYTITLNKAYSNGWSFLTGINFDLARIGAANPITPNQLLYQNQNDLPAWDRSFHANATYAIPGIPLWGGKSFKGLQWSSNYILQSGNYYSRTAQIKDANGTTDSFIVNGHFGRYPAVGNWDNRITYRYKIKDRETIELRWDLYNTTNANYVTAYKSTTVNSSTYLQPDGHPLVPSTIVAPRIMEYGASFKF